MGENFFFAYQNFFFCISPEKTSAGLENFFFIFDTGSFDTRRFTLRWKMRFFASLDQRHVTNLNPLCFIKILIQKGFQICENPFSGVFYMKIFKKKSSKKSIIIHLEIHHFSKGGEFKCCDLVRVIGWWWLCPRLPHMLYFFRNI